MAGFYSAVDIPQSSWPPPTHIGGEHVCAGNRWSREGSGACRSHGTYARSRTSRAVRQFVRQNVGQYLRYRGRETQKSQLCQRLSEQLYGDDGGGNESSKISAQSPAVMRWQNYTRSLVSKRLLIVFSQLRPFGTSQKRGADPRLNSPPSPNQTQCAELRNQLTCLAFPFTPSFRRNHVELLRWRTI